MKTLGNTVSTSLLYCDLLALNYSLVNTTWHIYLWFCNERMLHLVYTLNTIHGVCRWLNQATMCISLQARQLYAFFFIILQYLFHRFPLDSLAVYTDYIHGFLSPYTRSRICITTNMYLWVTMYPQVKWCLEFYIVI